MLRLSPAKALEPLLSAKELVKAYAGAESTVAINMAHWGGTSEFVTILPKNDLGYGARNNLREFGVNTDKIQFADGRIGTYYIEYGASIRPGKVTYDRQYSAISLAKKEDFNWQELFKDVHTFFCTGITPALSEELVEITASAFKTAKELGVRTCFDLNYRRTLWSGKEAKSAIEKILPYVEVVFGNAGALHDVFGIKTDAAQSQFDAIQNLCENVKYISITRRDQISAGKNGWSGSLFAEGEIFQSKEITVDIADRLGTGDAFAAGIIHGLIKSWNPQQTLDYAVAASALKHTIPGDLCLISEEDILEVANGNLAGYIKR